MSSSTRVRLESNFSNLHRWVPPTSRALTIVLPRIPAGTVRPNSYQHSWPTHWVGPVPSGLGADTVPKPFQNRVQTLGVSSRVFNRFLNIPKQFPISVIEKGQEPRQLPALKYTPATFPQVFCHVRLSIPALRALWSSLVCHLSAGLEPSSHIMVEC